MVSVDIPTAVLAVLVSVTLSPIINLATEGLKGAVKRYIEERDQLENWNHQTVELAKDVKIIWVTQYEEQDTGDIAKHSTWSTKVNNSLRDTTRNLRSHAQSAPPTTNEETEQKLMELIARSEAVTEIGDMTPESYIEAGERMKAAAEDVIDITPHK